MQSLRYRPELDGLRGIAVGAVVFYHAHIPGFAGGYLGVDVFFVISGYLITQLLEASASRPWSSTLLEFYVRRARRLLPALYTVLIASTVVAMVLLLPFGLVRFGRSLLLATVFLGNYGAWQDGGYFDPGWRFTPLRHLWSIAIEEQFYLIFPIALFVIAPLRQRHRNLLVAGVTVLSLVLAFWAASRWPVQNYYLLPTRAWELLIGVFLAMNPQLSRSAERNNQVLSMLGLGTLAAVISQVRLESFPGIPTVAACLGTAFLINGNCATLTLAGRVLAWKPLVFTGLISYSLYLWHTPILADYSYYSITDPGPIESIALLASIYLVSVLSWWAIERPFRSKSVQQTKSLLLHAGLPLSLVLAFLGYWLMKSDGLPHRFSLPTPSGTHDDPTYSALDPSCTNLSLERIASGSLCSFGPQDDTAPRILVWGDSHAYSLLPAYRSLADAEGLHIFFATKGACWPLPGAEAGAAGNYWHERCVEFNKAMLQAIRVLRPQRVILNAYWLDPVAAAQPAYLKRLRRTDAALLEGIDRTLAALSSSGASACAVLTVPGYAYPIPYALDMAQRRRLDPRELSMSQADALREYRDVEGDLKLRASQGRLIVADPKDVFCPGSRCLLFADSGAPLYKDANHVSAAGGRLVSGVLQSCFADLRR